MIFLSRLTLLLLAASVLAVLAHSPFSTNDGPVHLAFAKVIASHGSPESPLQAAFYALDLRPNPNLISYLVLVPAMKLVSAPAAESVLQALCILGPVLAGWFAIRTIDRRNEFLAVALFPFALNQMFFLGLYNYSLSIAAFFVAIGLYLRLEAVPTPGRAAALAAGLLLAFFAHAAGFMMAVVGIASMALAKGAVRIVRGQGVGAVLSGQALVVFSLLVPLPVCLLFASATKGAPVEFGADVYSRIDQFIHLTALDLSSDVTRYAARGFRTALAGGLSWAMIALAVKARAGMPATRLEQTAGVVAAGLTATLVMLFIPDTLGGGWTHFKRMVVFPYFWVVLLLACMPIPRGAALVALGVGAAASGALLWSAVDVQRAVERQMAPLIEVDRRIGAHCTVAPVVRESHPLDAAGEPMPTKFEPFFQAASRLELKHDRVVLFNYLARLDVYPVRFRPEFEPQRLLFGWTPYQHDVQVRELDVDDYERASGRPVDYLLVWGKPSEPNPRLRNQIEAEARRSELVYRSPDGSVRLYRRPTGSRGGCRAPES
ncbi:MAG: hypothetical protein ACM3Y9_03575 [Ignavibacteria bacterium]